MHPASAFIKPKYFKTRVKERKERARAGRLCSLRETMVMPMVRQRDGLTMKIGNFFYTTKG